MSYYCINYRFSEIDATFSSVSEALSIVIKKSNQLKPKDKEILCNMLSLSFFTAIKFKHSEHNDDQRINRMFNLLRSSLSQWMDRSFTPTFGDPVGNKSKFYKALEETRVIIIIVCILDCMCVLYIYVVNLRYLMS